jgi:excisionase family DNA binding protein
MENQNLLTVNEVAVTLRVHGNTVRKWLTNGQLEGKKAGPTGKKWLVAQSAVDAFIQDQPAKIGK